MSSTVLNATGYALDLADGRTLAPTESTEVDADLPHNRALIVQGHLVVTEGMTPRKTQPDRLVRDAARNSDTEGDSR